MKRPKILVVGSFVMDLIVSTPKFPEAGETVLGTGFQTAPGGKGANQAMQAAMLGADVTMIGKVGEDSYGQEMIASLESAGVSTVHVMQDPKFFSSIGNVQLEVREGKKSKNRIVVVPGANMGIRKDEIRFLKEGIKEYDLVMLQLEIPMEINEVVAKYAYDCGVPVMLNSAPSAPLSNELISHLTYISPNEHEAADLTGVGIRHTGRDVDEEDVKKAISTLREKGVKNVIITLGSAGAVMGNGTFDYYSPCIDVVEVKDPTAAGDSFVGAFCTAVSAGMEEQKALDFANYTATLTVSRMGAQPSLPSLEEVHELMHQLGCMDKDLKFDEEIRSGANVG